MGLERSLIAFLLLGATLAAQDTTTRPLFPPLPEGNNGIAAKYLGDVGIDRDPSVVLADDFENPAFKFDNNWGGIVLTPKPENVHGGKQAMECAIGYPRKTKETGLGVNHHFKEGYDTLFLRYYADLDYAGIAEALGISRGTVSATLHAAHSNMQTQLTEVDR